MEGDLVRSILARSLVQNPGFSRFLVTRAPSVATVPAREAVRRGRERRWRAWARAAKSGTAPPHPEGEHYPETVPGRAIPSESFQHVSPPRSQLDLQLDPRPRGIPGSPPGESEVVLKQEDQSAT